MASLVLTVYTLLMTAVRRLVSVCVCLCIGLGVVTNMQCK